MKGKTDLAKECLAFINESVSCYHAVENVERELKKDGYIELKEKDKWTLIPGQKYYVNRGGASMIAFQLPAEEFEGFHIAAAHSDFPTFKLKTNFELPLEDIYLRLNTEGYGGMIHSTWFDRCLSVAGRIVYRKDGELAASNVNIDEDLLVIPSLAIHMDWEINKGKQMNLQKELLPLTGSNKAGGALMERLAKQVKQKPEDILGSDLFLYVREKGKIAGIKKELLVSPRLDDLECVFAISRAFLEGRARKYCNVCAVFNNEEVGSLSRQGAASTLLKDVLQRIGEAVGKTGGDYLRLIAGSFLISADNAHALHPNYTEKADPVNRPVLNGGIVIKHHGGQKYATDAYSAAVMKELCREASVPCQEYHNRSDISGGSTLGNLLMGQVAVSAVDIGFAQLAMHSAVESAGSRDVEYMVKALTKFFE